MEHTNKEINDQILSNEEFLNCIGKTTRKAINRPFDLYDYVERID